MNRASLLAALRIAAPALGDDTGAMPALSHFCFEDDTFYAWNDLVAVIVSYKTGLNVGLHGATLLGVLGATRAETVELKPSKDGETYQLVGGGNVKLPALPPDQFMFNLPDDPPNSTVSLTQDIKQALEVCLISVSDDSLKPEYSGVTLLIDKTETVFYSTDNVSATRVRPPAAKVPGRVKAAMVLPKPAADLLLKLFPSEGSPKMWVGEKVAIVEFGGDPEVTMVTKLLGAPSTKLADVFDKHVPKTFAKIPEGFGAEIEKAKVLCARDSLKELHINVSKEQVNLGVLHATLGKMHSHLKVEGIPDGEIVVNPELVARILPFVSMFAVNSEASLVFAGGAKDATVHIVSAVPRAVPATQEPDRSPPPTVVRGGRGQPTERIAVDDDDIPF